MGKRKNQADHHKTTIVSDPLPNSSQMEAGSAQNSSPHRVESSALTPIPSLLQQSHDSVKLSSPANLNNSTLQRNPRYCNRKYSRRNSTSHVDDALTSRVNEDDEKMILKFRKKCISNDATMKAEVEEEEEEECGNKQGRISISVAKSVSMDRRKMMVCGICERVLRKKTMNVCRSLSVSEPSVVAVLVCGHLYHADCLEQTTCSPQKTDPSCPLCIISKDHFED